jgi:DNA primase
MARLVFDFALREAVTTAPIEYTSFKQYHPYFAERGISEKVAEAFDLGFDEFHNSVVLPLFDRKGKCIMLIKRSITEHVYHNTSGASKTDSLYGIHMIYRKLAQLVNTAYVFVVEGPFDVLKMWQAGYPAVGIMQASISEFQVELIRKLPFSKVVIATDNDEAGRHVAFQLAAKLSEHKEIYMLKYPKGCKDAGDMTEKDLRHLQLEPYA